MTAAFSVWMMALLGTFVAFLLGLVLMKVLGLLD